MKHVVALVLCLGFYVQSAWAFDPFEIGDIRVEGIQRTDAGTVFSYLPIKVGDTVDETRASEAVKALFATGFFNDVRLQRSGNVLVIVVQERPAIAQIDVSGSKEFPADQLKEALQQLGLKESRIFDRALLNIAEQELKNQYIARLCLTNPLTVRIAADTIREYFRAHPEANSYGFSPPDGAPRCYCDDCEAANHGFENESGSRASVSDVYYNFVNRVAARVAETFPDRYLVTLAYSNRVRPPEALDEPLCDNVIIQIARLEACTIHALDSAACPFAQRYFETVKAWARCGRIPPMSHP